MLPFERDYIQKLTEDQISELANLDSLGFLVGSKENFEEFKQRLLKLYDVLEEFEQKVETTEGNDVEIFEGLTIHKDKRIPLEIIEEAGELTEKYYCFSINWAPGFFMSKDIGPLWGGCAISDDDEVLTVFLIRSNFQNKRKWFIYNRSELLAHELCHTARNVINDNKLEEFFAYQTAPTRVRRYMGNCFIYRYDAIFFLLPTLILLIAQLGINFYDFSYPIWPFWIFAAAYPVFLLVRNNIARTVFFRACSKLLAFGFVDASAILFRCDWLDVKEIASLSSPEAFRRFVQGRAKDDLSWKVIQHRFVIHNGENEDTGEETDAAA